MNALALLQLAVASSGYQNVLTTLQDAQLLYKVEAAAKKAGRFDAAAMAKDGSLQPVAQAAERTLALANKMLADKTQGPLLISFLESL